MTNDKQKDRLVELIGKELMDYSSWETEMALAGNYDMPSAEEVIADKLLADGWMILPCKVGDKVYRISTRPHSRMKYVQETTISRIAIDNEGTWLFCTCNPIAKCVFGKTVFLTKEEAEAKLKEGVQG